MDPYRLPRTVVPTLYDLRLEPDLTAAAFAGRVVIDVTVHEPTAVVVLNAAELSIDAAAVEHSGTRSTTLSVSVEDDTERLILRCDPPLPAGPARLDINFRGTLNDRLRGFYRSRYRVRDGESRTLAATQFEATDARRAFPCWDEPAFKAVFRTTLVVETGLQVVSNTAIAREGAEGGRRVVRFADSIPMSTYLVAFIVGELEASEPRPVGATPVRAWCVPGKSHLTRFGLDVAVHSLAYFEGYFARAYPGDKLDLIAIPDFAAGAMENLGAVTFRETALLVNEASATHAERERVAEVVAHENAHMWFGDLVTMDWWNGLWLNEAFATFMEMKAVDDYRPAWQRWTAFAVSRAAAFAVDGLRSTRPVEFPVAAPAEAEAMFDVLTYQKGASLLRMLEQHLGEDVFRAGVRQYLATHAFGNATTSDLWTALGTASGAPVGRILHEWVFAPGYPVVSVAQEGRELVLRQSRFSYLPPEGGPDTTRWQVPLALRLGGRTHNVLLAGDELRLDLPSEDAAVLVNAGGHGFYRVRYSVPLLARLLDQLGDLSAVERYNLIGDAWAAVLAGLVAVNEYLELTARFTGERDRNVWSVLLGSFHALSRVVDAADRPLLARLVRDRAGAALAELGWEARPGESDLTGALRGDLIRAVGTLGDDSGVQAAAAEVARLRHADAGVAAAAVAVLAHVGAPGRYEEYLHAYGAAATPQDEQRYLHALAGFRDPELVGRTLSLTLDGTVRSQDSPSVLRSLLLAPHGRDQAWKFVRGNWAALRDHLPPVGYRRLWEGVSGLVGAEWEQDVRRFVAEIGLELGGRTLAQYLEQLRINVRFRQDQGETLGGYLRSR